MISGRETEHDELTKRRKEKLLEKKEDQIAAKEIGTKKDIKMLE